MKEKEEKQKEKEKENEEMGYSVSPGQPLLLSLSTNRAFASAITAASRWSNLPNSCATLDPKALP